MQLIDANDVYKIIGDTGIKRVHVTDIDQIKRIDPESLPVVKQLRAEIERLNKGIENLSKNVESAYKQRDELRAELERVKKERDAAVEMLHSLANEVGACTGCKRLNKECSEVYICECDGEDHWEWCEVKED